MRRTILWVLFVASLVMLLVLTLKTISGEDDWVCDGGQWVRHGNPSAPQPKTICPVVQSSLISETSTPQVEVQSLVDVVVFFSNIKNDPDTLSCETTYSTSRQALLNGDKYSAVLAELLNGPSDAEKELGFFTSINSEVKLPNINFLNGVLTLNFSSDLGKDTSGSCRVSAIRSQIVNTMKQFSEVKEVIIAVDGRVNDVLQP